ncbi:MAG TPA: DEAD/DEAH box helicase family protein [Nitrososphaeraceae archaeon]|nr:DEAD/DEAH box helicase family protein [Nitrososphaeraceae archaeon]
MYIRSNGDCCFNHIIGLSQKDGNDKPLYDYQQIIFDSLISNNGNKHLWIKKATGLGISEFMLRFMAWLCLKDNALSGSQMCIVTGPRIDLAIALIDRMKRLFAGKGLITFDTKETVIELNGVKIEAFPSHHLDAMRGLPNVSFILLDEADFFPPGQQQDARNVSERYIAKSNPYIVMVSTPNAPEGLFERIEKEPEDTCLYKRLFLDYTYGIGKIYTAEEIEKAKQSPSFEREYNLKYLGKIGNVCHTKDIEAAIEMGRKYNPDVFNPYSHFTTTSMGIDPAYGSSAFGIVVTQWEDNHIQILYAEEHHRPDYNEMLSTVYGLMSKYQVDKVYIDGANPSFIKSLKLQIGEEADYDKVIARYKSEGLGDDAALKDMKIVPVNFNKEHKAMLDHCKMILEQEPGKIAIHPNFDKLITALRTAVDADGTLDKESTSYNDIFDAFRLALKFYHFQERTD